MSEEGKMRWIIRKPGMRIIKRVWFEGMSADFSARFQFSMEVV